MDTGDEVQGVRVKVEKRTAAKIWRVKERLIGAAVSMLSASTVRCNCDTHLDAVNGPA